MTWRKNPNGKKKGIWREKNSNERKRHSKWPERRPKRRVIFLKIIERHETN